MYRAKFAPTVFAARQLINHGHIRVNKKKVNIASYLVKNKDLIEVRDKSKKLNVIDSTISSKERDVPEYIKQDDKNKIAKLLSKFQNFLRFLTQLLWSQILLLNIILDNQIIFFLQKSFFKSPFSNISLIMSAATNEFALI